MGENLIITYWSVKATYSRKIILGILLRICMTVTRGTRRNLRTLAKDKQRQTRQ
jgi:hypothetical protein